MLALFSIHLLLSQSLLAPENQPVHLPTSLAKKGPPNAQHGGAVYLYEGPTEQRLGREGPPEVRPPLFFRRPLELEPQCLSCPGGVFCIRSLTLTPVVAQYGGQVLGGRLQLCLIWWSFERDPHSALFIPVIHWRSSIHCHHCAGKARESTTQVAPPQSSIKC